MGKFFNQDICYGHVSHHELIIWKLLSEARHLILMLQAHTGWWGVIVSKTIPHIFLRIVHFLPVRKAFEILPLLHSFLNLNSLKIFDFVFYLVINIYSSFLVNIYVQVVCVVCPFVGLIYFIIIFIEKTLPIDGRLHNIYVKRDNRLVELLIKSLERKPHQRLKNTVLGFDEYFSRRYGRWVPKPKERPLNSSKLSNQCLRTCCVCDKDWPDQTISARSPWIPRRILMTGPKVRLIDCVTFS